jgi:aspartate/tyrosine/aromatic aminotransferase
MFENLTLAPPDAILGLTEAYNKDANPNKINLSVGVYKDAQGKTPALASVKKAEEQLLAEEDTKSYLPINGLANFGQLARELLFGKDHEILASQRATSLQTPGGTGALRVAADFLKRMAPDASIWCSNPTWVNHPKIFEAADRRVKTYDYIDGSGTGLNFEAMLASLKKVPSGDVVLLHACCHNPTGIDPKPDEWRQIADVIQERNLLPLVDFAYQGFGNGLEQDAAGLRELCRGGSELLVCSSCSKNFGMYCERVGALTIVAGSQDAAQAALSHAKICVRVNYSNPPKHGAAVVAQVLGDAKLRGLWEQELTQMRDRINAMRRLFVDTMKNKAPQHDFSFIAQQRGMFSFSGLTPVQVDELRTRHSVYVVTAGGRINVAGMTEANMDRLGDAVASVL